jgi:hypothetical protein
MIRPIRWLARVLPGRHARWRPRLIPVAAAVAAVLVLTGAGAIVLRTNYGDRASPSCRPGDGGAVEGRRQTYRANPACRAADAAAAPEQSTSDGSGAAEGTDAMGPAGSSGPASRRPSAGASAAACLGSVCGWPDASNTGHRGALVRKEGNITIREDNEIIRNWDLHGMLDVYANNVTVTNCRITSRSWWGINLRPGYTGLKVTHCTITAVLGEGPDNGYSDYGVSNMGEGAIEVGWNNISNYGNAISMGTGYVHDNYVHDLAVFVNLGGEYQHTDAIISSGGAEGGLVIRHNTLLNQTPIDKGASAAVGLFPDAGPVRNTTVDDNLIAGGAYALYGGDDGATNIKVTNNVFSTRFWTGSGFYGPVAHWNGGGAGNVWSNNKMSTGEPVNP